MRTEPLQFSGKGDNLLHHEAGVGHILLLEDDRLTRSVLLGVLQGANHLVAVCADADEVSELMAERDFDVVLASVDLPGMSGAEVVAQVAREHPDTEVILVARQASVRDAVACLRAGAFDFLEKPLNTEDVEASVARAVERRRLRATNALYEACQRVFADPDPEQLPQRIVELSMEVMAADDASLMLPDEEGRLHLVYSHRLNNTEYVQRQGQGVAGRLAESGRPALINDVLTRDPTMSGAAGRRGGRVHSSIVYPLKSGERLLGVLNLNRMATTRPFRRADLGLAGLLANQTVLALDNARLFREQKQRVRELLDAQGRLVESERLAAVGQVAAGLVHEINNPASYILANIFSVGEMVDELAALGEALEDGADVASVRAIWASIGGLETVSDMRMAIGEASEGARRIRDILRDVRALSATSSDMTPKTFDLNDAVRSALRLGRAAVQDRAQVEAHLGSDVEVVGDAGRLSQVFLNLLVNAAHAIEGAPGDNHRVAFATRRSKARVTVTVSDTGSGIPEAILETIFDPFFTTRPDAGGTGLGLSISRDIVRDHGGELTVDSVAGVGTTFTITLPAAEAPSEDVEEPLPVRLLFVTRDPAARRGYARQFGQRHEVTVAGSVDDVRVLLQQRRAFDLVTCEPGEDAQLGEGLRRFFALEHPEFADRLVFVVGTEPDEVVRGLLRTSGAPRTQRPVDTRWLLGLAGRSG